MTKYLKQPFRVTTLRQSTADNMLDFRKLYFPSAALQIFPRSLNIFSLEAAIRTTLRRSYANVLIFYQSFILCTVN